MVQYIAARGSREFKWRLPDKITIRNSAIGGICMGFGASVAGGCSIGNGLVETATMMVRMDCASINDSWMEYESFLSLFVQCKVQQQSAEVNSTQIV
ncbi:YeeE/YedE thiosulfate transporter family protein [Staphylococcus aureus]